MSKLNMATPQRPGLPMHRSLSILGYGVLVLAATASWSVQAQSSGIPPLQTQGNVKYVCGGIGSRQSTAFREAMRNHPLSLMFVNRRGEFLAAVAVNIKNDAGVGVLSIPSSGGPICLIDLAPGRYSVTAEPQGKAAQTRVVGVGTRNSSLEFSFP
ncbi:carboxypeptidase regulatory-like domain-containing protein [Variovorax sp. J22R24]|uniref:carboxypeptidase regulatory-like domain-containing protein n=1 Tax=Variovorax gracilis TaxID=3053502 RepID=UPI00257732DC|nr:carboxypeptidase regulatory-like domain-containing protein [Variovorax sp. J22R24]MDM0108117.1 carboxypeptidase regulatory-like domain-containing protein [Variovorax sp. J22R24]